MFLYCLGDIHKLRQRRREGGVENPQNPVNVIYGGPLMLRQFSDASGLNYQTTSMQNRVTH